MNIESEPETDRVELFAHLSWDERQALADRLEQIQHNFEAIFKKNGWLSEQAQHDSGVKL